MVVVDALEGETADELEAHAVVAVDELEDVVVAVDELEDVVVAVDELKEGVVVAVDELEDVAVAVDELEEGVVVAVDKLKVVEGGAVREPCLGNGEVGRVKLTAAAAYVTDRLSFSSSKKHSVGSFGPTHVAIGRLSSRAPWKSEVEGKVRSSSSSASSVITPKLLVCWAKASLAWAGV